MPMSVRTLLSKRDAAVGCLLGMAVGDALGLPYESLSARRAARILGPPDRHRLIFGRGMVSDDTEHACMTLQALLSTAGGLDAFERVLAGNLRRWLLLLPAGCGLATGRAVIKLLMGFPPHHSGVYSAGNGPAMRSTILGAVIDDPEQLRSAVRMATRMTHTDPKAEAGALTIALAVRSSRLGESSPEGFLRLVRVQLAGLESTELLQRIVSAANSSESTIEYAARRWPGRGISGYILDTVEAVLHAWFQNPLDYGSAVTSLIRCGGDTDTTAAIAGGIIGAAVGLQGIPPDWLHALHDWPRTNAWMESLAESAVAAVESRSRQRVLRLPVCGVLPRNLLFLAIVLGHGFRRLFPPY
ncbi:MAG: ADP-ribosylglycohydrolase family protein [Planctomycetaceae bacterium]|nr:ADP-ribosylglycohydrolase family protein [Planctomycetaceae bacterium]